MIKTRNNFYSLDDRDQTGCYMLSKNVLKLPILVFLLVLKLLKFRGG